MREREKLLRIVQEYNFYTPQFSLHPCHLTILVCYCKKQINVSFLCVCPLIDDDFRHNIVKIAVDPRGA